MTDEKPTHLDLFSGIGGFAIAAQWAGFRTIGFCEIDKYCQKVLAKNFLANTNGIRFDTGRPAQPLQGSGSQGETQPRIFSNIFDLDGRQFAGVGLITGGFPCQPFSVAGKRRGAADDRAIWPEMFRVISEARPTWVLGENVPGIIPMELDNVLSDLEGIGYATRSFVIPACAVDARHRRDRLWIVAFNAADAKHDGSLAAESGSGTQGAAQRSEELLQFERSCHLSDAAESNDSTSSDKGWGSSLQSGGSCGRVDISNSEKQGLEGWNVRISQREGIRDSREQCRPVEAVWLPEPNMGRVAHGIPSRVDRLKGLGNAIVPQVAYEILRVIRNLIYEQRQRAINEVEG